MAGILSNSSQESFKSSVSNVPSCSDPALPPQAQGTPLQPSVQIQASAYQAAGLSIYDMDSYLADPKNANLLNQTPNKGYKSPQKTQQVSNPPEPVSLGSKSSHHVASLNQLCQAKGIQPLYEIDGDISNASFSGVLKVGDTTVTREGRWTSKKETREALAEKGLEVVSAMETTRKKPGTLGVGRNWVGLLIEYHNHRDPTSGPVFNDYALGTSYACECVIPSLPDRPFGSKTNVFPSKKAARANSAKLAVEYLIEKGELNPDGSIKARKKFSLGAAVRAQGSGLEISKDATYAQKVNDMCPLLGLKQPQYNIAPTSALAPNMLSGHASFPGHPGMPKEIGEVSNVFGKKNAKEEVARAVWKVLVGLAQERDVRMTEVEEMGSC